MDKMHEEPAAASAAMDETVEFDVAEAGILCVGGARLIDIEACGVLLMSLSADVIQSAYAGLPPDDVRRQPYPAKDVLDEMEAAEKRKRWTSTGVDVLAMRLQYGRGMGTADVGELFSLGQKMVQQRVRDGKWSSEMSDANRIDLARRVWLAGLARLAHRRQQSSDFEITAAALQSLRIASTWQALPPEKPMWNPVDGSAHELSPRKQVSQHELETQSLLNNPANPDRTYRDRVAANLERLIARLEKKQREKKAAEDAAMANAGAAEEAPPENLSNGGL
jgi:hypothetical protein